MSIEKGVFLRQISALYAGYTPNIAVLEGLQTKDVTTVCGPNGMGKTTTIRGSGLLWVVAETIRDPVPNDSIQEKTGVDYIFQGDKLDEVLAGVVAREYVQISTGPTGSSFYGTKLEQYPDGVPGLLDVLTEQIPRLKALPFGALQHAFVVMPTYDMWMKHTTQRGRPTTPEEWAKRRNESARSLRDGLDGEYTFILNDDKLVAAQNLRDFAAEGIVNELRHNAARAAAHTILEQLQN